MRPATRSPTRGNGTGATGSPRTLRCRRRAPSISPAARSGHGLSHDGARGHTVLFGGNDGTALRADTWEWDGTVWNQVTATGPAARATAGLAWDGLRRRTVMFGGGI